MECTGQCYQNKALAYIDDASFFNLSILFFYVACEFYFLVLSTFFN